MPPPASDVYGKEVILVYDSLGTVRSDGVFWTDSNGRQFIRRVRDRRSYPFTGYKQEPVASNYYPITTGGRGGGPRARDLFRALLDPITILPSVLCVY